MNEYERDGLVRFVLGADLGRGADRAVLSLFRVEAGKVTGYVELETEATLRDEQIRALMQDRAALDDATRAFGGYDRSVEAAEIALRRHGTPTMSIEQARAYLVRLWNERAYRGLT